MKRLVLGMFIAAAVSQAAGCIIVSDDDDDGGDDVSGDAAQLRANWTFTSVAGTNTGCSPDADTIAVITQQVDSNGAVTGGALTDIYNCSDLTGITDEVWAGPVIVYLEALNCGDLDPVSCKNTTPLFKSLSQTVDLTEVNHTINFDFVSDGGQFVFDWQLVNNANSPITCDQVTGGIDGVELISTLSGTTEGTTDQFPCEDGYGVTDPLIAGQYTLSIDAYINGTPPAGGAIGDATTLTNKTITAPNGINDLGSVMVNVDQ